ncbi:hypothetical protein DQ239_16895 [Blastococcus sp. TF02-09]|uniref:hypothetical protein n=1 Tax=Blastococcus sp. TF02-09 TaxID=2250576 RepID=UPI000DEA9D50|nr:hypothetical protein [Blastococcus sp. TF02-9]RBY75356.1 hypothetical protein DQ239_16895 [Blastococcus sp. TF02-9]
MTLRSPSRPLSRWAVATLAGAALALTACGQDADDVSDDGAAEVAGGAVGPDVPLDEDVDLQQVQLEFPLDGRYDEGEDARMFFAVTNTGSAPVTLTDISGPDFAGVLVEKDGGAGLPLQVDGNDTLYVGAEGPPNVTLRDLGRSLRSSQSIPVTFTFADAGAVTVDVPVSAEGQSPGAPFDFPDDDPDQDPTEDGASTGGTGTES